MAAPYALNSYATVYTILYFISYFSLFPLTIKKIIRDEHFPSNPRLAIIRGYEKAEKAYLELADQGRTLEKSGSCAVAALIVDHICYIANVGDSRAILSSDKGHKTISIT